MTENREELRRKLRAKIGEKEIMRSSKEQQKATFERTLKDLGIDKDKLKEDMKKVYDEQEKK